MNWKNITEIAMGVGIGIMAADVAKATSDLIAVAITRAIKK
jgi:hypothetical protein